MFKINQVVFVFKNIIKIIYKRSPVMTIQLLLLSTIVGFFSLPIFYLEKIMIDYLVSSIGADVKTELILQIAALFIAYRFFHFLTDTIQRHIRFLDRALSRNLSVELEILMGKKIAELDVSLLEDPTFTDKYTRIRDESSGKAWSILNPLSNLPTALSALVSAFGILLLFNPLIVIGAIIVSIPQFYIDSRFIKNEYALSKKLAPRWKKYGWLRWYLTRNRSMLEIKLLGLADHMSDLMKNVSHDLIQRRLKLERKRFIAGQAGELPLELFEVLISVILGIMVITQRITIGSFQLYIRTLRAVESQLGNLVYSFLQIYENYMYVKDLVWFLNLDSKIEKQQGSIKTTSEDKFTIEFKDVWFRYKDDQSWILKGINLKINVKENIALVGVNGAGKSTFIKLLCRFHDPTKGKILIGGVDLKDLDINSWRNSLAVLFQEFETYPFSAREAIGFGDISRMNNLDEIKDAAKATNIHEYIESLPKKYDNPLDPEFRKGVKPSIGQQQRIGISRMLFRKNSRLIIMDEPTASVDPEAEEEIFKELIEQAKVKILIFVTQRFSTVRLADRIIVMESGKIIESGSHEKLIGKKGKYAKLFKIQAKGYQ